MVFGIAGITVRDTNGTKKEFYNKWKSSFLISEQVRMCERVGLGGGVGGWDARAQISVAV